MSALRDVLAHRADDAGTPDLGVPALIGQGERRLRRRRMAAVLGAASAVVVVIALAVGTGLTGPSRRSEGPVDRPTPPAHPALRDLVYSDVLSTSDGVIGRTVHLGNRVVETGNGFVHLDVTDDGFLYTARGGAWFSDGGTPQRIGSHLCSADPNGEFSHFAHRAVMASRTGSLAVWFDCTDAVRPALVVVDTATSQEVVHQPVAFCRESCELVDVTEEYVYFDRGGYQGQPRPEYRLEVSSRRVRPSTTQEYADDLTSHARGLVVGGTRESGTPTDGIAQRFALAGSRLVPLGDRDQVTTAFDTATGRALRLTLPASYHPRTTASFELFTWLGDDTVALAVEGAAGDLLTCRLSNGRCVLAVRAPTGGDPGEAHRILPNLPLPG